MWHMVHPLPPDVHASGTIWLGMIAAEAADAITNKIAAEIVRTLAARAQFFKSAFITPFYLARRLFSPRPGQWPAES